MELIVLYVRHCMVTTHFCSMRIAGYEDDGQGLQFQLEQPSTFGLEEHAMPLYHQRELERLGQLHQILHTGISTPSQPVTSPANVPISAPGETLILINAVSPTPPSRIVYPRIVPISSMRRTCVRTVRSLAPTNFANSTYDILPFFLNSARIARSISAIRTMLARTGLCL